MHRYSLTRRQALERLQQQARQEGSTVAALGERLINAQEVLAGLGSQDLVLTGEVSEPALDALYRGALGMATPLMMDEIADRPRHAARAMAKARIPSTTPAACARRAR